MIPTDFEYYRPETIGEALETFARLDGEGKEPYYLGGGTEIITMARMHNLHPGAVIDLKAIPECNRLDWEGEHLVMGAAVSLTRIAESGVFPLLKAAGDRVADHTVQDKITLGGNVAGTIIYHEAMLPLLTAGAEVVVESAGGSRRVPLARVFDRRLRLERGEFLSRFLVAKAYTACPYFHVKKTRSSVIDYPLVTVAAVRSDGRARVALSGICAFPFRALEIEEELNRSRASRETRVEQALARLPAPVVADIEGSAAFRMAVLRRALTEMLQNLEGTV